MPPARFGLFWAVLIAYFCVMAWAFAAIADQRVHLTPKLAAGEVLRYQIDSRTTTAGTTTTPLANPEGGSQIKSSDPPACETGGAWRVRCFGIRAGRCTHPRHIREIQCVIGK